MTFSVKQRDVDAQRIIGMLWAGDESLAQALAAVFFPTVAQASLVVQRTEDREIPLRMNVEADRFR